MTKLLGWLICLSSFACLAANPPGEAKWPFWQKQTKGTNYFNEKPEKAWFKAAADLGIQWIRLTYGKWDSSQRDFLMGNADHYKALVEEDLKTLMQALDWAHEYQLKVVITPLGLPGNRWFQNNDRKRDLRLWNDFAYWQQSAAFWRDLASHLNGHPAVVAYNILNEPTPEMGTNLAEHNTPASYLKWHETYRGTPRDLPSFYERVIQAIRQVDRQTPIMLDSGWYAQPVAFSFWPEIKDSKVLYSFHMYEPFAFTNRKNFREKKQLAYPGKIPFAGDQVSWNRDRIRQHFAPLFSWAAAKDIPENRLVASEFGCYRRNTGCADYLSDVLTILNENQVHWAFYAFREDEWDGYDYELGTGKPGYAYWQAKEKGNTASLVYKPNALFDVIKGQFKP